MIIKQHAACERGATLLELLIAVVMVSTAVVILSLVFPKATANIANNRERWLAGNFATTRVQELKAQPYALITPNISTDFGTTPLCDCSAVDMGVIPSTDAVLVDSGITYYRKVCINLVDRNAAPPPAWTTACADNTNGTDKGLKNIRVRVSWNRGSSHYVSDTEGMATR